MNNRILLIYFKKKSAFGLGDRNRKSEKWVEDRIEFCVQPIFRIFEFSIFGKNILKIPINFPESKFSDATATARDRARYAESRVYGQANFKTLPWLSLSL